MQLQNKSLTTYFQPKRTDWLTCFQSTTNGLFDDSRFSTTGFATQEIQAAQKYVCTTQRYPHDYGCDLAFFLKTTWLSTLSLHETALALHNARNDKEHFQQTYASIHAWQYVRWTNKPIEDQLQRCLHKRMYDTCAWARNSVVNISVLRSFQRLYDGLHWGGLEAMFSNKQFCVTLLQSVSQLCTLVVLRQTLSLLWTRVTLL